MTMTLKDRLAWRAFVVIATFTVAITASNQLVGVEEFDQAYLEYGEVLRTHVIGTRVNYTSLQQDRPALDVVVDDFGKVAKNELHRWTREQQIAYWINAYNAFTLQAIVNHYPIQSSWFSLFTFTPRNSIKQIRGVWTRLQWRAGGTDMTLDGIEHNTLRVKYDEPRIHFAINCAAVSCPPLRREPFVAAHLNRQLILAARDYLASDRGIQVDGNRLRVSSIFNWYGEDFINGYAHLIEANQSEQNRAILGVIAKYGPRQASVLAQNGTARIRYLRYDWSLNDTVVH